MNFSVNNADRATHLRIVVTALAASIAMVAFTLSVRIHRDHLLVARPPSGDQITESVGDERARQWFSNKN